MATQKKGLVPEVNRQSYYNEVLREVPQECISVPMVLFGMVEQVCYVRTYIRMCTHTYIQSCYCRTYVHVYCILYMCMYSGASHI